MGPCQFNKGAIFFIMPIHMRRIFILFISFLTTLLLTACEQSQPPSKEIQLVQNSKESYGTVYDTLLDLGETSIIQKIPPFGKAAEFIFSDLIWSSFESKDGLTFVQMEGNTKVQGVQTPVIIQWRIEGDENAGSVYPVPHAFNMNGETQQEEVFDSFSVSTLYNMDVLTDEELTILSLIMPLDESIFPMK